MTDVRVIEARWLAQQSEPMGEAEQAEWEAAQRIRKLMDKPSPWEGPQPPDDRL